MAGSRGGGSEFRQVPGRVPGCAQPGPHLLANFDLTGLAGVGDAEDVVDVAFEGVVVGDDDELAEAADGEDLLGEVFAAFGVQVLGGFVEEGDVEVEQVAEEGQADGQGGGHLLAAGELAEAPFQAAAAEHDVVVGGPAQAAAGRAHDVAVDLVGAVGHAGQQDFGDPGASVAQQAADELGAVLQAGDAGDAGLGGFQVGAHLAQGLDVGGQALLVGLHAGGAFGQLAGEAEGGVAGLAGRRERRRVEAGAGFAEGRFGIGRSRLGPGGLLPGRCMLDGAGLELAGHDFVLEVTVVGVGVLGQRGAGSGQGREIVTQGL